MRRLVFALWMPLALVGCPEPTEPAAAEGAESEESDDGEPADDDDDDDDAAPEDDGTEDEAGDDESSGDDEAGDDDDDDDDDSGGGWDPNAIPASTGPCPSLEEGWNTFCPSGIDVCREAHVRRGAGTGGPLVLYWHGLYQQADFVQTHGAGQAVMEMALAENGIAIYPEADPDALNQPNYPYPWWSEGGYMTDRKDDFFFMDEIVGCAVESGLIDPDRISTAGMSAGGMLTSNIVGRRGYFASAVSWSGGRTDPFTPPGPTPVMVIHGGPNDCFGGFYCFMGPSEFLAQGLVDGGSYAFLCDHSMGDTTADHHADAMGVDGAEFIRVARRGEPHPYEPYVFGQTGDWVLDNYCYAVGDESPWAPWDGG